MSVATEISRLQTAKSDIKTAIEAKGVTVPSSAKIDTYDDYIAAISSGPAEYVDLGLPSGKKWATGNITQRSNGEWVIGLESERGAYFSFGNVDPHFSWCGSLYRDRYNFQTNYDSTQGYLYIRDHVYGDYGALYSYSPTSGYDAARELLGGTWRTPTSLELLELLDNTDKEVAFIGDSGGIKFMNKTDHSKYIYIPSSSGSNTAASWGSASALEDLMNFKLRTCTQYCNNYDWIVKYLSGVAIPQRSYINFSINNTQPYEGLNIRPIMD